MQHTPRRRHRSPSHRSALLLSILAAACGGGIAPLPPSPPPGAAPLPAVQPVPALFRHAAGERRVVVENHATVSVTSDSAVAQDTIRTTTWARYRISEGNGPRPLEVTIDSMHRSAGPLLPGSALLAQPVRFTGTVLPDRIELPVDSMTAADCSSPVGAMHGIAKELIPSIPQRLVVGARWEESVTTTACRGGAVLTMLARHHYQVPRDGDLGGGLFRIARTTEIRISGSGSVGGEAILTRGDGSGSGELLVDRAAGQVVESSAHSRIELSFTALGRSQRVVQESEQRLRALDARR